MSKSNVVKIEKTDSAIIDYNVTDADLLAALEYARPFLMCDDNHVFEIVDAAINKAKGL